MKLILRKIFRKIRKAKWYRNTIHFCLIYYQKVTNYYYKKETFFSRYLPILLIVFLMILGFVLAVIFNLVDIHTLTGAYLIPLTIALITSLVVIIESRKKSVLMSLTYRYLLDPDDDRLDELLGALIVGKWEQVKIDPIEEFFSTLNDVATNGSFESRRRISEALPALFRIDFLKSKTILEILRSDFDNERWRSDIRRRTIESMSYILKKDESYVLKQIRIKEKDEIFVIIAIIEILYKLFLYKKVSDINVHYRVLISDLKKHLFSDSNIQSVKRMWKTIKQIKTNKHLAIQEFFTIAKSDDLLLKIFAARNYRLLCDNYPNCIKQGICNGENPEQILSIIELFLQEGTHKHIRRPLAKEDSLECFILMLKHSTLRDRSENILLKIFEDEDYIIRITAFDKVEKLLVSNEKSAFSLASKIICNVIKSERDSDTELKKRAERLMTIYHINLT